MLSHVQTEMRQKVVINASVKWSQAWIRGNLASLSLNPFPTLLLNSFQLHLIFFFFFSFFLSSFSFTQWFLFKRKYITRAARMSFRFSKFKKKANYWIRIKRWKRSKTCDWIKLFRSLFSWMVISLNDFTENFNTVSLKLCLRYFNCCRMIRLVATPD